MISLFLQGRLPQGRLSQVLLKKSVVGSAYSAFFTPIHTIYTILLCTLLTSACGATEPSCPPFAPTEQVTVAKIVDGDTVHLQDGRKVRLIGINTPELGRDGKPGQPYAQQARRALQQFIGSQALLLTDQEKHDRHGRTLAYLYNLDGQSAEAHLLEQGLGWHVAIPPNITQAQCLAKAEQRARRQRTDLWGANGISAVSANNVSQGGFQRISGKITEINFSKRGWWFNMGDQIAAVIYPENQHRFERKNLESLKGKTVTIRGWVYPSRSKKYQPWRVKLETPYAINTSMPAK